MNPVNVVFVYLLVRDTLRSGQGAHTVYELQCNVMTCLYLAFSYMGNEISYPLKPFLIEENRSVFWTRVVTLMDKLSANMLKINRDPRYFTELFYELKSFSLIKKSMTSAALSVSVPRDEQKLSSRKSSYMSHVESTDTLKSEALDGKSTKFQNKSSLQLEPQVSRPTVKYGGGFNSSQSLAKYGSETGAGGSGDAAGTLSSSGLNDVRASRASLMEQATSSFYKSYEQNRPGHKVVFSSNESHPVAYCI